MTSPATRLRPPKGLGVVLVPALAALVLVACGDDDGGGDEAGDTLARARAEGSITIGFADEKPYGYEGADGEPTGQSPEVAEEVLSRLGIDEVDGVNLEFGSLIPGLDAERVDIVAAGMFITPERAERVLFSDPDLCATTAFGVVAGNPLGLETFDDVAATPEARLGVVGGAVEDGYATGAGVLEGQVQRFADAPSLFAALVAGRIDAASLTAVTVRQQIGDLGDAGFEATEGFVPVIDGEEQLGCGGYAFRREDRALRDEFNRVLHEMKEAGEVLPIVEPFGFTEAEVDAADGITVEDLVGEG